MSKDQKATAALFGASAAQNPSTTKPAEVSPRLLTRKEVCRIVGVSYTTIFMWMTQGKFPRSIDCNGIPRWRQEQVDQWISSRPLRAIKMLHAA